MTTISNETEWNTLANSYDCSNHFYGTLDIISDITFTSTQTPLHVCNGSHINGNDHSIFFNYDEPLGLFVMPSDGDASTIVENFCLVTNNIRNLGITGFLLETDAICTKQSGTVRNICLKNKKST